MESIKRYWDERAALSSGSLQATTNDIFLRELEITKLTEKLSTIGLPQHAAVLDLGCGDGYSTLRLAAALPTVSFLGVDYSENMLAIAEERLRGQPQLASRVSFRLGDARQLIAIPGLATFDVILTVRCLINLPTAAEQFDTLRQVADRLNSRGFYFGIENFLQGHENMNRLRTAMALPEIPIRWHNCFLDEDKFLLEASKIFDAVSVENFSSSYYLATRVIYSAMCQLLGEQPDYTHPIHRVAGKLPMFGDFSPIKLVSMQRRVRR